MTKNSYWRLCLIFAIVTVAATAYILPMFPATSYADTSGYGSPVFAFEMAASVEDMINVFGPESDPLRTERINQMDRGNYWDFGFMFLYAMFLGLFSLAALQDSGNKLWLIPAASGFASAGFDAVENLMLLKLTSQFNSPQLFSLLWLPVYAKFYAIAISCLGAAFYILKKESNLVWKALSVVAILGGLSTFIGLTAPSEVGWILKHAITWCWLTMLVYAAARSIR